MKKRAVLIRKLYRAYNNKENIEYSKWKGYPEDTYFGYYSFEEQGFRDSSKNHSHPSGLL